MAGSLSLRFVEENVTGDFLGVFFTPDGRIIEPYAPSMTVSHISSADLRELSRREDTIVLLAAGGKHKVRLIRQVLEAKLCNALITDADTALHVLGLPEQGGELSDDDELAQPQGPGERRRGGVTTTSYALLSQHARKRRNRRDGAAPEQEGPLH
jgi:hypothetical protein